MSVIIMLINRLNLKIRLYDPKKLKPTQASLLWLNQSRRQVEELVAIFKEKGPEAIEPIDVFNGEISDGHHRWQASLIAKTLIRGYDWDKKS